MLNNTFNFLSKLTFKKIVNAIKIYLAYFLSSNLKKEILWGMPISISIEPTSKCNLNCPECPTGLKTISRQSEKIKFLLFKKIIDELASTTTYLNLYLQGEPFLHPEIFDLINYAHKKNIYTDISTNGHFLDKQNTAKTIRSGLDRITISMDGVTQKTYSKYRTNGNLSMVIDGIKNLVDQKKQLNSLTPYINIQFLVFKHNQDEIEQIKRLGKKLGVNSVNIKSAQIYSFHEKESIIPEIKKYSRYSLNKNGNYTIKNKLKNQCKRIWLSSVITCDGKVSPCCFDKDTIYGMGSIEKNTFKSIWINSSYSKFRFDVLKNRKNIEMCRNCTEGLKVPS